jgi:hypothetical protein
VAQTLYTHVSKCKNDKIKNRIYIYMNKIYTSFNNSVFLLIH